MSARPKILFLCTGNSCRSQMAEAILKALAPNEFEALSAGSHPAGYVHPLALEAMRRLDIPMEGHRSKSWDEYADENMGVIITVCDAANNEPCPNWPGNPTTAHWSLPDPAGFAGDERACIEFALRVAERLFAKIRGLVALDWPMKPEALQERLTFLGEI